MFLNSSARWGEHVFESSPGRPLTAGTASKRFKKYVLTAGLDAGLHFHSLRHTGVSWLINKGVPAQFVQQIAGHSSLNVTRIYTHFEDKNLLSAVRAFGPLPPHEADTFH
jgi:integrase/recombinase XerD